MTESPFVKICGITKPEDAVLAAGLGASFIGMIFYPQSRRHVPVELAREIAESVRGSGVRKVAVFVDPSEEDVRKVLEHVDMDLIQLHGNEPPDFCSTMPRDVIKTFCVNPGGFDPDITGPYREHVKFILFDSASGSHKGGTGMTFDWGILPPWISANPDIPFFLAGGLRPENIRSAAALKPFCLDVNSGIESSPGIKDHRLMKFLFEALHAV